MSIDVRPDWILGNQHELSARSFRKMFRSIAWAGNYGESIGRTAFKNYLFATDKELGEWERFGAIVADGDVVRLNPDNVWSVKTPRVLRAPSSSSGESWTYFIGGDHGPIKIGSTSTSPERRLKGIQTGSAEPLEVLAVMAGKEHEAALHERFGEWRLTGEWFRRDAPGLLDLIASLRTVPA